MAVPLACIPMTQDTDLHPDAALIEQLGGSTGLAKKLGASYTKQTVNNWRRRGIPELEWRRRPDLFGPFPEDRVPTQLAA